MAKHKRVFFSLEDRIVLDAAAVATSIDVVADQDAHAFSGDHGDDHSSESNVLENISNNTAPVLTNRVVIVDERADPKGEIQQYLRQKNVAVHVIEAGQNGVEAIGDILDQYDVVDTLDIISHGEQGRLELGDVELSNETLDQYLDELKSWSSHFSDDADILLYGCDVASGSDGVYFIERIAEATQADVAASDDVTGQSGDWELEKLLGVVDAKEIIEADPGFAIDLHSNNSGVPTVEDVTVSTEQGESVDIELDGDDPDASDSKLDYHFLSVPDPNTQGVLKIGNNTLSAGEKFDHDKRDDIKFIPLDSFSGTLTFQYVAEDNDHKVSDPGTLTIIVESDFDNLSVQDVFVTGDQDGASLAVPLLLIGGESIDSEENAYFYFVSLPDPDTEGVLVFDGDNEININDYVWYGDANKVSFVPVAGFSGTVTFDYFVRQYSDDSEGCDSHQHQSGVGHSEHQGNGYGHDDDDESYVDSAAATITITIEGDTVAPEVYDVSYEGDTGKALSVALNGQDPGPDNDAELTYHFLTVPDASQGVISLNGVVLGAGDDFSHADRDNLVFTPTEGFTGEFSLEYVATDLAGNQSDSATLTIDIEPIPDLIFTETVEVNAGDDYFFLNDDPLFEQKDFSDDDYYLIFLDVDPNAGHQIGIDQQLLDNGFVTVYAGANNSEQLYFYGTASNVQSALQTLKYQSSESGAISDELVVCLFKSQDGSHYEHVDINTIEINIVNVPNAMSDVVQAVEDAPLTIALSDLLSNDQGGTGALNITAFTQPDSGSISLDGQGNFVYTPSANFNGQTSFSYTVTDAAGKTDTAIVTVNVAPVADPLTLVDDSYEDNPQDDLTVELITPEDTPLTIAVSDLLANDEGADLLPDSALVVIEGLPSNGEFYVVGGEGGLTLLQVGDAVAMDATLRYVPNENVNGEDGFQYSLKVPYEGFDDLEPFVPPTSGTPNGTGMDAISVQSAGEHEVSISFVGETAGYDNTLGYYIYDTTGAIVETAIIWNSVDAGHSDTVLGSLAEGQKLGFFLVADGGDTSAFSSTSPEVRFVDANGNVANVNAATAGNSAFILQFKNNNGQWTTHSANSGNGVFHSNAASLNPDNIEHVVAGAIVQNGETLLKVAFEDLKNGKSDWDTSDLVFTVKVAEQQTSVANVVLNVTPVNDAPVAVDDSYRTDEDTALVIGDVLDGVLANDSDLDGDALEVASFTQPANGSVVLNVDGTFSYTPNANFNGDDGFSYTVSDNNGGTATGTVNITVDPVSDVPVAVDDVVETSEDVMVEINVLGNDTDLDGDSLSVEGVTQPANGTVTINPDGTLTYVPNPNFNGVDTFFYTITDGNGGSDMAAVTVTVTPQDDCVVAVNDVQATNEDTPVTINVLDNDTDLDGDTIAVQSVTQPANGTVTINPDGTVTYVPNPDFNGIDTFTYTITDGNFEPDISTPYGSNLLVNPSFEGGLASGYQQTTLEGWTNNGNNIEIWSDGFGGVNAVDGDNFVELDVQKAVDVLSQTVATQAAQAYQLTFSLQQRIDGSQDQVEVYFGGELIDAIIPGDDWQEYTYTVTGSGSDVLEFREPANQNNTYGPLIDNASLYTTTVTQGQACTDTATVTVNVTPVNDGPVAVDDAVTTSEDTPVVIDVVGNDTDVDGTVDPTSVTIVSGPSNGTLSVDPVSGEVTYTPNADYNGSDSFSYTVSDDSGAVSSPATVNITVTPVNDAPEIESPSTFVIQQGDSATIENIFISDIDDNGENVKVTVTSSVGANLSVGSVSGVTVTGGSGSLVLVGSKSNINLALADLTYTSSTTGVDTLTINVNDLGNSGQDPSEIGLSGTGTAFDEQDNATILVTVNAAPPPEVEDFSETTHEDIGSFDILSLKTLADNDSSIVSFTLTDIPSVEEGTLYIDGVAQDPNATSVVIAASQSNLIEFIPAADFNGEVVMHYQASDASGNTSEAVELLIVVSPVNDAPVIAAPSGPLQAQEGHSLSFSGINQISVDDIDSDTANLRVTLTTSLGELFVGTTTNVTVTGNDSANLVLVGSKADINNTLATLGFLSAGPGNAEVVMVVSDLGNTGVDPETVGQDGTGDLTQELDNVAWEINVNDAPQTVDDNRTILQGTPVTINVLGNDTDTDSNTLSINSVVQPSHGSVVVNANGTVTYTPNANYSGQDTFSYTIRDEDGGVSVPGVVSINVKPSTVVIPPFVPTPEPEPIPQPGGNPPTSSPPPGPSFQPQGDNGGTQFGANNNNQVIESYQPISYDLRLVFDLPDRVIRTDSVQEFSIPNGAFIHTSSDEKIAYEATMPDGSALPSWIQFNADKGDFIIDPPDGIYQTLDILVTAKDGRGNKASSTFTVILLDDGPAAGPVEKGENIDGEGGEDVPQTEGDEEIIEEEGAEGVLPEDAMLYLDDEQIQALLDMQEMAYMGDDFVPFSLQLQQSLKTDLDIYAAELLRDLYKS